jgi:hypothetical protein
MKENTEFLGYKVEKINNEKVVQGEVAYKLTGKRGAEYRLVRNKNNPKMFVMNQYGNIVAVKGNYTFDDSDGRLNCVY